MPEKIKLSARLTKLTNTIKQVHTKLRMLSIKVMQDLAFLQERQQVNYIYLNALAEYLKEEHGFTEEKLDKYYKAAANQVIEEKREEFRKEVQFPHAFCETCFLIQEKEKFVEGDKVKCPRCESDTVWFATKEDNKEDCHDILPN